MITLYKDCGGDRIFQVEPFYFEWPLNWKPVSQDDRLNASITLGYKYRPKKPMEHTEETKHPVNYTSADELILSRQADLLGRVLKTIGIITFFSILLILFLPGFSTSGEVVEPFIRNLVVIFVILVIIYMLRRGWVMPGFFSVITFVLLISPYTIYMEAPGNMQMLTIMILPIALAGFLPGRKQFWWVFAASVVIALLAFWAIVTFKQVDLEYRSVVTLILMMTIVALMTDGISSSYRESVRFTFEQLSQIQSTHNQLVTLNEDLDKAVTKRKKAESESNRSARIERLALDASQAGVFSINLQNMEADLPSDFLRRAGIPVSPATWTEFIGLMQPESRKQLTMDMLAVVNGHSHVLTGNFSLRNKQDATWLIAAETLRDGNDISLSGVLVDVSERLAVEKQQEKMDEKIRETQRLESLGVLAGGIAHDFNNLLHVIVLNADMARRTPVLDKEAKELLDSLLVTADRAADLCSQLLAYSGRGQFIIEAFDLSQLVKEMSQLLEVSKPANTKINYRSGNSPIVVEGDITQIRQIVMNLITNAGEAIGDAAGEITISISNFTLDAASSQTLDLSDHLTDGQYACIEVKDDGCGMDQRTRTKIFDPFFTTKSSGRGLGLSAVLGIVKSHSGSISLSTEVDQGTTVKILLPISNNEPASLTSESQMDSLEGEGKILFADDEPEIRNLARIVLSQSGFDVIEASDGIEAVELFQLHKDDLRLVILDVMMPGMTGIEVYDRISTLCPTIPVILSSGYNENDATLRVTDQEQSAFLKKPYTTKKLHDMVNNILKKE